MVTIIPTVVDGDFDVDDFYLATRDAVTELQTAAALSDAIFVGDILINTSVNAATLTALNLGQTHDPRNWFTGGVTVTPNVAGWYECIGYSALATATTVVTTRRTGIEKNGVLVPSTLVVTATSTATATWPQTTSGVVHLNGTTENVRVAGYFTESSGSGARNMQGALSVILLSAS